MIFVDTGAWYASLVPTDPDHEKAVKWILAWATFERFDDKHWSFTDCTSKVVMEQLGITVAFAFDHHFHQFGTIQVVP